MPRRPDRGRALPSLALDAVLLVAATTGVLVGVWCLLGATLGLQLVTFATGSMSPTYPAASLAVSRPIALAAVRPGDVVTVDRGADELPITHRVVSIRLEGREAVVRLKGDANSTADPFPYRVTALRLVVVGVPAVLAPLALLETPAGSVATLALTTLAVGWALWPRRRPDPRHGRRVARPEARVLQHR